MKLLLVESAEYLYPLGGANKANKLLMEYMVQKGHDCVVISVTGDYENFSTKSYLEEHQEDSRLKVYSVDDDCAHFEMSNVEVYTVMEGLKTLPVIRKVMEEYKPELVLVSDDYPLFLLETMLAYNCKTVFIAHCQTTLSFGPECYENDPVKTKLFHKLDGIVSVSDYVKDYFKKWADLDSERIYFPSYGEGPFSYLGSYDNPYVTVINPSSLKGFSIFIEMARHMKDVTFAAIPTWATTRDELSQMQELENIKILEPVKDMDEIFSKTKVFLMPSLWGEALGQVIVEALLRGVPVIASQVGGITEAMLGLDYLLPVKPIEKYVVSEVINRGNLEPIVPEQDWESWVRTLRSCIEDYERYTELSHRCYETANAFNKTLSFEKFESYFIETASNKQLNQARNDKYQNTKKSQERLNALSADKKEKLARLLWERRKKNEHNG